MSAHLKTKTAAKVVVPRSQKLAEQVTKTMATIADIVGSTLGPGGSQVLIERQEWGVAPVVTKDGVTVMQSLGFQNAISHVVFEAARDAAVRTVSEAGDGTTTATVLAYALVKASQEIAAANPTLPPQQIVRTIQRAFDEDIEPHLRKLARQVQFDTDEGKALLRAVAKVSANGEDDLADAVLECFRLVGDKGNVSLTEQSGPSSYKVEKVDGYPVPVGYEDSCGKFMTQFVNDLANNRVFLEGPSIVLYNGTINDPNTLLPLLNHCQNALLNSPGIGAAHDPNLPHLKNPGIVIIANGFSDSVLGTLMLQWTQGGAGIKVLPMRTPRSPLQNGEVHFLDDLAAVTGATVLDPLSRGFDTVHENLEELGQAREFEMLRFRSNIIGIWDEEELVERIELVEQMAQTAVSELDKRLLLERVAALSGGVAKLVIVGSSNADIKERKDRADDAVRAVQGALKHGVLPGGGWGLLAAVQATKAMPSAISVSFNRALLAPALRLLTNAGVTDPVAILDRVATSVIEGRSEVYNVATGQWVDAYADGLLDSVPAVVEAIRNSISIATLLGTLGGVVVFERDSELERTEARAAEDFNRNANVHEANERW